MEKVCRFASEANREQLQEALLSLHTFVLEREELINKMLKQSLEYGKPDLTLIERKWNRKFARLECHVAILTVLIAAIAGLMLTYVIFSCYGN